MLIKASLSLLLSSARPLVLSPSLWLIWFPPKSDPSGGCTQAGSVAVSLYLPLNPPPAPPNPVPQGHSVACQCVPLTPALSMGAPGHASTSPHATPRPGTTVPPGSPTTHTFFLPLSLSLVSA